MGIWRYAGKNGSAPKRIRTSDLRFRRTLKIRSSWPSSSPGSLTPKRQATSGTKRVPALENRREPDRHRMKRTSLVCRDSVALGRPATPAGPSPSGLLRSRPLVLIQPGRSDGRRAARGEVRGFRSGGSVGRMRVPGRASRRGPPGRLRRHVSAARTRHRGAVRSILENAGEPPLAGHRLVIVFAARGGARGPRVDDGRSAATAESPADDAVWHVLSRADLRERRDSNSRPPA